MGDILLGIGVWFAVSLVVLFMFALGAALGRRSAWEEGYRLGLQVGEAKGERRPRDSHDGEGSRERKVG